MSAWGNAVPGVEMYDVVVVGASFAGLAFASAAAARSLRVLVLERDASVGGVVRTTGVLFSDVLDVLDVPQRFLLNSVRRVVLRAPDAQPVEIRARAYRFYMADVTGMLQWMAAQAEEHGAKIRCGASFTGATRTPDGSMLITYGTRAVSVAESGAQAGGDPLSAPAPIAAGGQVRARFLIGADGAHSSVARHMGLDQNTRFLAGAEWLVDGVHVDDDSFSLVMDHELAPGYCLWLAPHGKLAALGVAGHQRAFKPTASLQIAQRVFSSTVDMRALRVVERKGGVIPVGGRLRHVYRDDAVGCALLLGDAAGLCGAATGGGIYPALICGRLAAHAVANEVLNGVEGAVRRYLRDLPHASRLGQYLRLEDWIRRGLDRISSNADVSAFYSIFATQEGHALLQRVLLETPIISMDGSLFAAVRAVLGKSPTFYGSALKILWHQVLESANGRRPRPHPR